MPNPIRSMKTVRKIMANEGFFTARKVVVATYSFRE